MDDRQGKNWDLFDQLDSDLNTSDFLMAIAVALDDDVFNKAMDNVESQIDDDDEDGMDDAGYDDEM